jgi:hypothetical protein
MLDVQKIRYVTSHYPQLQGLRLAPLGAVFIFSAVWRAGWLSSSPGATPRGAARCFLVLLAVALVASFPIQAWYQRRFGVVRLNSVENGTLALGTFAVMLIGLLWVEERIQSPVPLAGCLVAAALASIGAGARWLRPQYVVIAAACLIVRWLRPSDGPGGEILADLVVGIGLLVAGIGDHVVLTRALRASWRPDGVGPPPSHSGIHSGGRLRGLVAGPTRSGP